MLPSVKIVVWSFPFQMILKSCSAFSTLVVSSGIAVGVVKSSLFVVIESVIFQETFGVINASVVILMISGVLIPIPSMVRFSGVAVGNSVAVINASVPVAGTSELTVQ